MTHVRDIYLPTSTLHALRNHIRADPLPTLKALSSDPIMVFERKGQNPVRGNNPFLHAPIDDIVEALKIDLHLRPAEPGERRRRKANATCSIRVIEGEIPQ